MLVLGVSGSPRRGGNSETLLDEALTGAREAGAGVEKIILANLSISPCTACGVCDKTGECPIADDMQDIYRQLSNCNALIFASPIYFYSVTAWAKAAIDRSQALWARKYVLQKEQEAIPRQAAFIGVGATRGKSLFDGPKLTMKYFFDAAGFVCTSEMLLKGLDGKDAVLGFPEHLRVAREIGRSLLVPR
ncbi:MAG: flavodoxin family protein [Dethiobacter sp.]|nr:flavodoxin family protein [Dethiobacter sp.]